MKLTNEQIEFAEENYNLLRKFMIMHRYNEDTYFGVLATAYVMAVKNFDVSKGFKFSTYLYAYLDGAVKKFYRDSNAKKRKSHFGTISYDDCIGDIDDEETDIIFVNKNGIEDEVFQKIIVEEFMNILSPVDKNILSMRMQDKGQVEIAKTLGIGQASVSRALTRIKERYNAWEN